MTSNQCPEMEVTTSRFRKRCLHSKDHTEPHSWAEESAKKYCGFPDKQDFLTCHLPPGHAGLHRSYYAATGETPYTHYWDDNQELVGGHTGYPDKFDTPQQTAQTESHSMIIRSEPKATTKRTISDYKPGTVFRYSGHTYMVLKEFRAVSAANFPATHLETGAINYFGPKDFEGVELLHAELTITPL